TASQGQDPAPTLTSLGVRHDAANTARGRVAIAAKRTNSRTAACVWPWPKIRAVVDQSVIASLILMSGLPRELLDQQAKNCKRSRCPSLGFVGTCPMLGSATF